MHHQDFYSFARKGRDAIVTFLNLLIGSTKLADRYLTASEYKTLQHKVEIRMEFYVRTWQLNHFLESERDGTPKKTKLFRDFWGEFWGENADEDSTSPTIEHQGPRKKRMKVRHPKQQHQRHSEIYFPMLLKRASIKSVENTIPAVQSTEDVVRQTEADCLPNSDLTSLAGSALSRMATAHQQHDVQVLHGSLVWIFRSSIGSLLNFLSSPVAQSRRQPQLAAPTSSHCQVPAAPL